jgi:hypothetical protein
MLGAVTGTAADQESYYQPEHNNNCSVAFCPRPGLLTCADQLPVRDE